MRGTYWGLALAAVSGLVLQGAAGTALNAAVITSGNTGNPATDAFLSIGGDGGPGQMEINGGMTVTSGDGATVGTSFSATPGGQGDVTIRDTGSNWTVGGAGGSILFVGENGTGNVTVRNNGSLNVNAFDDPGFSDARIFLGGNGTTGTLTVQSGGKVRVEDANGAGGDDGIQIGRNPGSGPGDGALHVQGGGSEVVVRGNGAFINVGNGADGTLEVKSGARLAVEGTSDFSVINIGRAGSKGAMLVDDAEVVVNVDPGSSDTAFFRVGRDAVADPNTQASTLTIQNSGKVTIDGGNTSDSPGLSVALNPGSSGILTVTGSGSELEIIGNVDRPGMTVGRQGEGQLIVSDGGLVDVQTGASSDGGLSFGGSSFVPPGELNGRGTGLVTGANSKISATGDSAGIAVGNFGAGSLTVENGGAVESKFMWVGTNAGSQGTLNVNAGSQVALTGVDPTDNSGAILFVGRQGTGSVNINDGAISLDGQTGDFSGVLIGGTRNAPGGIGQLNMSGANASLSVTGSDQTFIGIGRNGIGVMRVEDGASVTLDPTGSVSVATTAASVGTLIVDGANSTFDAGAEVRLAQDFNGVDSGGTATAVVRNGGVIKATNVHVGTGGILAGDGTVMGNLVNEGGLVGPGLSPGTLSITGDYIQLDGVLVMEIDGTGLFDVLDVGGLFDVQGGLIELAINQDFMADVLANPGLLPSLDDLFGGVGSQVDTSMIMASAEGFRDVDVTFNQDGTVGSVTAASAVPEPAAFGLLGLGLLGLGAVVRRRGRSGDGVAGASRSSKEA
ncbi:MAG: PEP-CTERM sorting domain-containing protein [Minwuiales bacterium]|nr:PEP-CTERM sorting domain-containing protein [Minwuiales bacterium]